MIGDHYVSSDHLKVGTGERTQAPKPQHDIFQGFRFTTHLLPLTIAYSWGNLDYFPSKSTVEIRISELLKKGGGSILGKKQNNKVSHIILGKSVTHSEHAAAYRVKVKIHRGS